jgi:hypothetical protein
MVPLCDGREATAMRWREAGSRRKAIIHGAGEEAKMGDWRVGGTS